MFTSIKRAPFWADKCQRQKEEMILRKGISFPLCASLKLTTAPQSRQSSPSQHCTTLAVSKTYLKLQNKRRNVVVRNCLANVVWLQSNQGHIDSPQKLQMFKRFQIHQKSSAARKQISSGYNECIRFCQPVNYLSCWLKVPQQWA